MAKYSNLIRLSDFLPVYDILAESPNAWKSFIPTNQFCDLLRRSLTAITSSEVSKRKSVWIRGTFGTGKSHASAAVKHLLCDDKSDIEDYLNHIEDIALRERIRGLRNNHRNLAVTLKGVEGAYDIPRFSLTLQKETQKAINAVDPSFVVQSSYQIAIDWIEEHKQIFEESIIGKDDELSDYVSTAEEAINKLKKADTTVYLAIEKALSQIMSVDLRHPNISEWLVEIEHELELRGIANGLILFWDEFTSVMDTLKSDRINVLQNIAEKSTKNNIFLFLISHRTEAQSLDVKGKDINKMSDRFDSVEYAMDEISTYLIMRHSFNIIGGDDKYKQLSQNQYSKMEELFGYLCPNNAEERKRIEGLYPLHPYTAFLCSTISNYVGSSNRTVIKFMHDEESGFGAFINNDHSLEQNMLLTADSLWDFFYEYFEADSSCSAFVNTYKTNIDKVTPKGDDYIRVFKSIILLNALSPKFSGKANLERIAPNYDTIKYIFFEDRAAKHLNDILDYFDTNKIVARNIFGEFKINASAYNQSQLDEQRLKVSSEKRFAYDIIKDKQAEVSLKELFAGGEKLLRVCEPAIYSCEEQESSVRSKLNKYTGSKSNYLHVGIFLSLTETSRDSYVERLKMLSEDFENTILVLPDESFSQDYHNKYIDCLATANVADMNFNKAEADQYRVTAGAYVDKWVQRLINGSYMIYFNGKPMTDGVMSDIASLINKQISPIVFNKGFETVKQYNNGSVTMTFFKVKYWDALSLQVIQAQKSEDILKYSGDSGPASYVFEDNGSRLVTSTCELSDYAKTHNYWIVEVCRKVTDCFEAARKKYNDRFYLSDVLEDLMHPPYGFFPSKANYVALAYALREHKADLFLPGISQPVSNEKLQDMIHSLFEMWKNGKSEQSNKVALRFGSPEEKKLTELLIDIFDLKVMTGVSLSKILSLENARWAIQEFCRTKVMQPVWTLAYCHSLSQETKDDIKAIVKLFEQENPSVEQIKSLHQKLSMNHVEINLAVTKKSNYDNGFKQFVASIEEVDIKDEWWDDLLSYIDTMQSEVAFRKESDVRQMVVKYYIRKKDSLTPKPTPAPAPVPTTQVQVKEDVVEKAKTAIKSANMPNMFWQQMLLELIDDYPAVAEYLTKYLS